MREIVVRVECDVCRSQIVENIEGSNQVKITVQGVDREMDLCDKCLGESFLQEARPVQNGKGTRKKPAKPGTTGPHQCPRCEMRFTKPIGVKRHMERIHKS